ncbi:hypothetical protein [Halomonas sp.]|uniref:hypothetical protein n=1 Tax=Halomonas sp. TaxID=1486246 RepID=UPI0039705C52
MLACLSRSLVLYRGDRHYGGAFARVTGAWVGTGKPHLSSGRLRRRGLHNAWSSGATYLMLPLLAFLASQASGEQLPADQFPLQASLRDRAEGLSTDHPLAGRLRLLLEEQ